MDKRLIEDAQYSILSGKPLPGSPAITLHNQAYLFWKAFWTQVLKQNGTQEAINRDEFTRLSYVTVIACKDEIIGLHAYNLIDLNMLAMREHSYFAHFYPPEFFAQLANRGISRVLTMEFFSVSPKWRSSIAGVSLGAVLVGLGLKIAAQDNVQAVISAARTDVAAGKVAAEQGAISLVKDVMIYNTPCDLIAFLPENYTLPKDAHAKTLIHQYWQHRQDLSRDITFSPIKKVA